MDHRMDNLIADLKSCNGFDSQIEAVLKADGWVKRFMDHGLEAWYKEDFGHWIFERPSAYHGLKTYFRKVFGSAYQVYLIDSFS